MAGTALKAHWFCREPGCTEGGDGSVRESDAAADLHTRTAGHATSSWAEPPLPIVVQRT